MKSLLNWLSFTLLVLLTACGGGGGGGSTQAANAIEDPVAFTLSYSANTSANTPVRGSGIGGTLSPSDLRTHYNMPFNYLGQGQSLAIVAAPGSSNPLNDLNAFSHYYGLPQCNTLNNCFQLIDLSNGAAVSSKNDWATEIALDTQWAHAVAPQAKIILVQAKSASLSDLFEALQNAVAQPNVVAVSMSWGALEFGSETSTLYDGFFKSHPQIAFFASAGDSGNNGSNQVYPAASPYVIAVGGTTIHNLNLAVSSGAETAWSLTGGGPSRYEDMSQVQKDVLTSLGSSKQIQANASHRAIPDIAYNADPTNSPVAIVVNNRWYAIGGTSEGAPQWAAITANFAQYLISRGLNFASLSASKSGFSGVLYQSKLDQVGSQSFYDVTSGTNNTSNQACILCLAQTGFDDLTGLGVPNVGVLFGHF